MRVEGDELIVKSDRDWYELERSGTKPNTVRLEDFREWSQIVHQAPKYIRVEASYEDGTMFTRPISFMSEMASVLGKKLVIVCWRA